jgi:hypothetical protein
LLSFRDMRTDVPYDSRNSLQSRLYTSYYLRLKVLYERTAWTVRKDDKNITETIHKRFLAFLPGFTLKTQITKWINKKQINSMKPSPSSEATSRSSTLEFINILWSSKVHYLVQKRHRQVPVLNQMNPSDPTF